ncbi:uncharacterized protein EI90DRAFT_3124184 [Cantharellus anzutake]|uniref:uncharacterized protein n=1 Tax=Cantharellus anzutake TaxID=1750568 RepID=UPI001904DEE6|nr:uncharacterized protein EI90DRAFT_3124184 [Cantharellus anzutake]KAF8330556.1 hypothetical protein EI90DRAFT_3124184 [Cantharellus anzutake]
MFKHTALCLLLFTVSVLAVQALELHRLAHELRDPAHGDTNTKQLMRGLPPLPPRNIEASRTDAARGSWTSDTITWSGNIKVTAKDKGKPKTLGYLALNGSQPWCTVVSELKNASTFTATLQQEGVTSDVSFKDINATASQQYLAGLSNATLAANNLIVLGTSELTFPPDVTYSGGSVSAPGSSYKTVVFDHNAVTHNLTAKWITEITQMLLIIWDSRHNKIFLTVDQTILLVGDTMRFVILSLDD